MIIASIRLESSGMVTPPQICTYRTSPWLVWGTVLSCSGRKAGKNHRMLPQQTAILNVSTKQKQLHWGPQPRSGWGGGQRVGERSSAPAEVFTPEKERWLRSIYGVALPMGWRQWRIEYNISRGAKRLGFPCHCLETVPGYALTTVTPTFRGGGSLSPLTPLVFASGWSHNPLTSGVLWWKWPL